jgi:hypothetical protein
MQQTKERLKILRESHKRNEEMYLIRDAVHDIPNLPFEMREEVYNAIEISYMY